VQAEGWGNFKGKIVVDGKVPAAAKLDITKDQAVCANENMVNQEIVVGKEGGLQYACVFLYLKRGAEPPAVHADYAKTANDVIVLDNLKCRFEPHVIALRTSQTLRLKNSDPVGHNSKIDSFNHQLNPNLPANSHLDVKLEKADRIPAIVSCSSHPWMQAKLLVRDEPYFAVTNEKGEFEIKNLPAGTWTFQFWQEKVGYLKDATLKGKTVLGRRGEMEIEITDGGTNDLGVLSITAADLTKE